LDFVLTRRREGEGQEGEDRGREGGRGEESGKKEEDEEEEEEEGEKRVYRWSSAGRGLFLAVPAFPHTCPY